MRLVQVIYFLCDSRSCSHLFNVSNMPNASNWLSAVLEVPNTGTEVIIKRHIQTKQLSD
jgi:hypothetical protein